MDTNISNIKISMIIRYLEGSLLELENKIITNSQLLHCIEDEMKRIQNQINHFKNNRDYIVSTDHKNMYFNAAGTAFMNTLFLKSLGIQSKIFHLTALLSAKIDEKFAIEQLLNDFRIKTVKVNQKKLILSRLLQHYERNFRNDQIKAEEITAEEFTSKRSTKQSLKRIY